MNKEEIDDEVYANAINIVCYLYRKEAFPTTAEFKEGVCDYYQALIELPNEILNRNKKKNIVKLSLVKK